MTALATQADVEGVLGRTLTAEEAARVDASLDRASATARAETGRLWEAGSRTVRRRARCGKVQLESPESVTAVVSVDSDGAETVLTGWTLRDAASTLYGLGCDGWVEVTYVAAADVADEVVSVVAQMAARDLVEERPAGATQFTVTRGPFTESTTFAEPQEAVEPTAAESTVLARYALRRAGWISTL